MSKRISDRAADRKAFLTACKAADALPHGGVVAYAPAGSGVRYVVIPKDAPKA